MENRYGVRIRMKLGAIVHNKKPTADQKSDHPIPSYMPHLEEAKAKAKSHLRANRAIAVPGFPGIAPGSSDIEVTATASCLIRPLQGRRFDIVGRCCSSPFRA